MARLPGTPNKNKHLVRVIVEQALNRTIAEELLALTEKDKKARIDVLVDLLPYCHPKLQAVTIDGALETGGGMEAEVQKLTALLQECIAAK